MAESEGGNARLIVEVIVGCIILVLAFSAIAASDVAVTGTRMYWTALVAVFGVVALIADRKVWGHGGQRLRGATAVVLHWLGILLAVQFVFFFVDTGRMANADTGLTNGIVLALGTYLSGIAGNWRLSIVGVALALATLGVAVMEEYLWVLFGIAVLTVIAFVVASRMSARRHQQASADA